MLSLMKKYLSMQTNEALLLTAFLFETQWLSIEFIFLSNKVDIIYKMWYNINVGNILNPKKIQREETCMWNAKVTMRENRAGGKIGFVNIRTRRALTKPQIESAARRVFSKFEGDSQVEYSLKPVL